MATASALPPFPFSPSSHSSPTTSEHPFPPASLVPTNPNLKTPSVRSRLSRLCQEGQTHLARQLFDTIPRPTTAVWNTLIIGFICNHMPHQALLFYAQMKGATPAVHCDSYTYSSTLKACAETRDLRLGKAVHAHLLRCQSNPSRIVHNSLLSMYATCLSSTDSEAGGVGGFDDRKCDLVQNVFDTMRKRNVVAWNTLVAWYVRSERYLEAVKQFRVMMRMGIQPSPVSFVNVFPAISNIGRVKLANVIYGLILKSGDDFVNDLYVVSSAIFMYAELGCLDISRKIFDHCLEKNTEVWTTMISAYVQNNLSFDGLNLFIWMLEGEENDPDEVTLIMALTSVSLMQQLDLALQLHSYIFKKFKVVPINILNTMVTMYSRCNAIEMSFQVFDKIVERDVISWNAMISAFVQNGMDDEGLMLAYEMQKQGFVADPITLAALLSAASNLKSIHLGKQIHAYLVRKGIQFEGMGSYLIAMYAKCGLIGNAEEIFHCESLNDKDQATWNSMISGYAQNGYAEQVFSTLQKMMDSNVMPNAVTIASILPVTSSVGSLHFGKELHAFSVRGLLDQNVFVATTLVDMYSKLGVIKDAETIFDYTPEKNSVTYTTMILGYGQHGLGERAISLFYSMKQRGIKPDAITFVAVLSACSYSGLVEEGLKIFASMESEYNIAPSKEHYCCIADMLGRVGRVWEAFEYVSKLDEDEVTLETWGSLLGACRVHRQFDLAEVICEKLDKLVGTGNRLSGYKVLLSNMYAEEGSWDSVDRVREEMQEKGFRKDLGQSWIDISGDLNYFASRDQTHRKSNEIYDMLGGLATEMQRAGYRPSPLSDSSDLSEIEE